MSMVSLPGLQDMINGISQERNLPKQAVEEALREALLKGYERYRRTIEIQTQFSKIILIILMWNSMSMKKDFES